MEVQGAKIQHKQLARPLMPSKSYSFLSLYRLVPIIALLIVSTGCNQVGILVPNNTLLVRTNLCLPPPKEQGCIDIYQP